MRFGFPVPTRGPLGTLDVARRLGQAADRYRFDSVWVSDHIVLPRATASAYPYAADGRLDLEASAHYLEPLTVLGFLAGVTQRPALGTSILVLPCRNPLLTAKMVATLDVMSGGRVILGVGVGWLREDIGDVGSK